MGLDSKKELFSLHHIEFWAREDQRAWTWAEGHYSVAVFGWVDRQTTGPWWRRKKANLNTSLTFTLDQNRVTQLARPHPTENKSYPVALLEWTSPDSIYS